MTGKWKKLSSKYVYRNPWYSLSEDEVLRPDGSRGKYFLVHKDPGVVIIPFDGKRIYLVNQYRYSFKRRMWELPAGKSEGKNYLAEARKELREETGLTAKKWTYLGEFACGPGHTAHVGKVYLAEDLQPGRPKRERGEADMIIKKISLRQLDRMIAEGEIIDSWAITPLYFFKQYLSRKK